MYHCLLLCILAAGPADPVQLAQAPSTQTDAAASAPSPPEAGQAEPDLQTDAETDAELDAETAGPAETGEAAEEAQADETAEVPWWQEMTDAGALGYLKQGGLFMYPLLLLGILAGGVIIERYRSLKMLRSDTAALRHSVHDLLHREQVEQAYHLCQQEQGPVPAILGAGLRKYLVLRRLNYDPARTEEQVVKSMDDYSVHIVAALERHLPVLATIASVAPMLGFLGTVQGMIVAFTDIVDTLGDQNIVEAAATGIKVSLLTTCFGLIIGIPAFMAFNYFTSVINRFVLEVEESAAELIETVTLHMTLQQSAANPSANAQNHERKTQEQITG